MCFNLFPHTSYQEYTSSCIKHPRKASIRGAGVLVLKEVEQITKN